MLGINAGQQTYLWRLSSLKRSANPSTTFDAGLAKSLTLLISSPCLLPLAPSFAFVDARTSILRIMASLSLAPPSFLSLSLFHFSSARSGPLFLLLQHVWVRASTIISLSLSLSLSRPRPWPVLSLSPSLSSSLFSLSREDEMEEMFRFSKFFFKDSGGNKQRAHPTIRNAVSLFGHGLQSFFASGPQRSEVTVVENFFYKEIALAVGKMNYKVWCYFHTHAREHEQNGISFDSSISPGSLRTLKVGSLSRPRRHSLQSVSS